MSVELFPTQRDSVDGDVDVDKGILLVTPTLDTGYEHCIDKGKCVLLSILGLGCFPDACDKDFYASRSWSLTPSGSTSYLWTYRSEPDGIMLRTSVVVKSSTTSVLRWLLERNIASGLERAASETVLVKKFHGGSVSVRRICCDSSSLTSSKRDFVVVTCVSMLPDGVFVVSSRSAYIPDNLTTHHRRSRHGYVRGLVYASGFVLRPVKCPVQEDKGCEVFYGAHLDMLGPPSGKANASKLEELQTSVLRTMERMYELFEKRAGDDKHVRKGPLIPVLRSVKPTRVGVGRALCACPNLLQLGTNDEATCPVRGRFISIAHAPPNDHVPLLIKITLDQKVNLIRAGMHALAKIRRMHDMMFGATAFQYPRDSSSDEQPLSHGHGVGGGGRGGGGTLGGAARAKKYGGKGRMSYENFSNLLRSGTRERPRSGSELKVADTPDRRDSMPRTDDDTWRSSSEHGLHGLLGASGSPGGAEPFCPGMYEGSAWETFYEHDDIHICELRAEKTVVGVVSAHCVTAASPAEVRNVLMHYPERVDGLLARRTVLNRLDNETFLQWMGYGPFWPLGLKDFLVVTSEENINDFQDGFVIASTSVDQICEEIDDLENCADDIIGKDMSGRSFQRSSIRCAGYLGVPDGNGGTHLTVFVDSDCYEQSPAWLVRLLAQYELCEMMRRIRAIPSLNAVGSGRSTPVNLLTRPQRAPSLPTELDLMLLEKERKKARDLEELLAAAETRKRSGSRLSRYVKAVNRIIGPRDSPVPTSRAGASQATADAAPPRRSSSILSSMLGRRGSKKAKDASPQRSGGGGAPLSPTASLTSSLFNRSTESLDKLVAQSLAADDEPRDEEDYNVGYEEGSEGVEDAEVIDAFRQQTQSSLGSDDNLSTRGSRSLTFPVVGSDADSSPGTGGHYVKEGSEIAAHALRLMAVYMGLEKEGVEMAQLHLDWQQRVSKRNMTVSSTMVAGSTWQAIRAMTTVAAEKNVILALLTNDSRMGEWDDMFDFITPLVKIDARTTIRRICCKPVWPTAPRDFLVCTTWKELGDGSILVTARSAPDDVYAQQKGYVRGFINISGYHIQPRVNLSPSDPFFADCPVDGCKLTLSSHVELGGNLPSSVINMLSTTAPIKLLAAISEVAKMDSLARPSVALTIAVPSPISRPPSVVMSDADVAAEVARAAAAAGQPIKRASRSLDALAGAQGDLSIALAASEKGSPDSDAISTSRRPTTLSSPSPSPSSPDDHAFAREGREVAAASVACMRLYLGLEKESAGTPALQLDWQQRVTKKNMVVYSSMVAGSHWQAIRAVTTIRADKAAILALLLDDARIGEFDDMFDFLTPLVKIGERTAARRICCKPVWPTAPRDFVVCTTWKEQGDGSVLVCSRSAPDALFPPVKGYVRGFLNISGFFIQPRANLSPSDPSFADCPVDGCKVTLTAHTELGGNLPSSVINMLSTTAPMKILTAVNSIVGRNP